MKIFFVIVGVGLIFSTLTGLYMSYRIGRNKALMALLFFCRYRSSGILHHPLAPSAP